MKRKEKDLLEQKETTTKEILNEMLTDVNKLQDLMHKNEKLFMDYQRAVRWQIIILYGCYAALVLALAFILFRF